MTDARSDTTEALIFGPTVEGLFVRGLRGKLSPAVQEQLRQVGLDVSRPILPAYSRQTISKALTLVASALYPEVATPEAWYQVGKHVALGVRDMTLGGAALAVIRLLGPERTMGRMARTFRSTNNYMTVNYRKVAPNHFELELSPSNEQPRYMEAVIEDLLLISGAKHLKVVVASHDPVKAIALYRITWG
jgi:uncharacterized protein (TIGR02265 family)